MFNSSHDICMPQAKIIVKIYIKKLAVIKNYYCEKKENHNYIFTRITKFILHDMRFICKSIRNSQKYEIYL